MSARIGPGATRFLVVVGLVIFWEVGVRLADDPDFLSTPVQMVMALVGFLDNPEVLTALKTTLWELLIAFTLAVAAGLPIGLAIGLKRFAYGSFYPVVVLLYAIPQATVLPLVILIFGIGPEAKIAFGFTHGVFAIIVNVVAGVQGIKPLLVNSARSMGASRRQILWNVVLPHAVPSFFTGLRLAMTGVLLGVLLAELFVSQEGVGHFTELFTESFQPPKLFALIAALATIAVTLNELFRRFERRMSRWRD